MSASLKELSNAVAIRNTQLAASMAGLGFLWRSQPLMDTASGRVITEFMLSASSVRPGFTHLHVSIAAQWESGALEKREPMHPLCVMMRSQHNRNRGVEMQRGEAMRLKQAPGSMMTTYRPGPEMEAIRSRPRVPTEDFDLAMALGGVGLPVVAMEGPEGSRIFHLPVLGYTLQDSTGTPCVHDARLLMQKTGPTELAIQQVNPMHPVSLAYDAFSARAQMMSQMRQTVPLLVTEEQGLLITTHPDFTGRIGDYLSTRLGAPFLQ